MNNTVEIKCEEKVFTMQKIEYARWLCLIEAIDLIERKASELKADMVTDDFWVKPLAFQKYIDQRLETMVIDVDREEFNIPITTSIESNKNLIKSNIVTDDEYTDVEEEDIEPTEEILSSLNS